MVHTLITCLTHIYNFNSGPPAKSNNMDIRTFVGKGHVLGNSSKKADGNVDTKATDTKQSKEPKPASSASNFYGSDSDDCIAVNTSGNNDFSRKDKQKTPQERTLENFFSSKPKLHSDKVTPDKYVGEGRNLNGDKNEGWSDKNSNEKSDSFVVLSDSDEELLLEVDKIFKASGENKCDDLDSASTTHKNVNHIRTNDTNQYALKDKPSGPAVCETSSASSEVQSKLRSVWGSRFQAASISNKGLSRIDINRKIDADNSKLTTKSTQGQKRLSDNDIHHTDRKRAKTDLPCDESLRNKHSGSVISGTGDDNSSRTPPVFDQTDLTGSVQTDVSNTCICPVCSTSVPSHSINEHLDQCLGVT